MLIALSVLAAGVLGALVFLLMTLRTAQNTERQSQALHLASDIAERLRGSATHPEIVELLAGLDYDAGASAAPVRPAVSCHDRWCSAKQLVEVELYEWKMRIRAELSGGRMRICHDEMPWQESTGAWRWDCGSAGAASAPLWVKVGWRDRVAGATPDAPGIVLPVLP